MFRFLWFITRVRILPISSVCLKHSGTVSKCLNVSSKFFLLSPLCALGKFRSVDVAVLSKCYRLTTTSAAINRLPRICLFHVTTVIQNVQRVLTEFIATDFHYHHSLRSSSQTKIQLAKERRQYHIRLICADRNRIRE